VVSASRARFLAVTLAALVSHLLLDAANVYGTHLLYPLTSGWYYGDAVFIFEPWVWLLLGVAVARNALGPWSRRVAWGLTAVPTVALAGLGLVAPGVLGLLAAGGAGLWLAFRRWSARQRAAVALAGTTLVFVGMFGVSRVARTATIEALQTTSADVIVDVATNPNPAAPWCWSVVALQRSADDASLTARRGTLSLWPGFWPADTCAAHRLIPAGPTLEPAGGATAGRVIWNREWHVDLVQLRDRAATDCRTRAWFQFGRMPFVDDGRIVDLRFDNPLGGNFSAMAVDGDGREGCPSNLPAWRAPRADVLDRP
jgi:inner membrane protein